MSLKWNSAEGKRLFDEWLIGGRPAEFNEEVEPEQITDLTATSRRFLGRRNATKHEFSNSAVRSVRGTSRLSGAVLGHATDQIHLPLHGFTSLKLCLE